MIQSYSLENESPVFITEGLISEAGWVSVTNPSDAECELIASTYGVPVSYLHAALDPAERPRVMCKQNFSFVLINTPYIDREELRQRYRICPLAFLIVKDTLITICAHKDVVSHLSENPIRGSEGKKSLRQAFSILFRSSSDYINYLREMDALIEKVETSLYTSTKNEVLITVLHVERALIYFMTGLKGNSSALEKLQQNLSAQLTTEEMELLGEALVENRQATDMADVFIQIIGSLSDVFGTIVSNHLNKIMKLLTGLTIIVTIPGIIGSFYGMNVGLPGQKHPYAYLWVGGACIFVCALIFLFFKKKDFL